MGWSLALLGFLPSREWRARWLAGLQRNVRGFAPGAVATVLSTFAQWGVKPPRQFAQVRGPHCPAAKHQL